MFTFLHKKRTQLFIEQFFLKFVRCTLLINIFWLEIMNSYTTKQWIICSIN